MKTVITLDPEYIPWEPGNPVVRLRRRKNKKLAAVLGIGFIVVIFGGMIFLSSQNKPATPEAIASPVTAVPATPIPQPTPALITRGQPGKLIITRDNVVLFYPCAVYSVRSAGGELASGDTTAGPIVDVTGRQEVVIECENNIFELP